MQINNTGQTSSQYTNTSSEIRAQQKGNTAQQATTVATNPLASNSVSLSDRAAELSALAKIIEAIPVVDETRVNEIKTKIDKGEYISNYFHTADNIINSERAIQ